MGCPTSLNPILGLTLSFKGNMIKCWSKKNFFWFQKSREKWIKSGSKNTKYFHTQAIIRRRKNKIDSLMIDGVWCLDEDFLKREALKFFKDLFESPKCFPSSLVLNTIPNICHEMHQVPLKPFTRFKVRKMSFFMDSYKALGLDGFQLVFLKNFWSLVGSRHRRIGVGGLGITTKKVFYVGYLLLSTMVFNRYRNCHCEKSTFSFDNGFYISLHNYGHVTCYCFSC